MDRKRIEPIPDLEGTLLPPYDGGLDELIDELAAEWDAYLAEVLAPMKEWMDGVESSLLHEDGLLAFPDDEWDAYLAEISAPIDERVKEAEGSLPPVGEPSRPRRRSRRMVKNLHERIVVKNLHLVKNLQSPNPTARATKAVKTGIVDVQRPRKCKVQYGRIRRRGLRGGARRASPAGYGPRAPQAAKRSGVRNIGKYAEHVIALMAETAVPGEDAAAFWNAEASAGIEVAEGNRGAIDSALSSVLYGCGGGITASDVFAAAQSIEDRLGIPREALEGVKYRVERCSCPSSAARFNLAFEGGSWRVSDIQWSPTGGNDAVALELPDLAKNAIAWRVACRL